MTAAAGQALAAPFAWRTAGGLKLLTARLPSASAIFSTRTGGVSEPPYSSLNLGDHTGDGHDEVAGNRRRLLEALGREAGSVVWARQVHGAELELHDRPAGRDFGHAGRPLPEADGQITRSAAADAAGAGRRLPARRDRRPGVAGGRALWLAERRGRHRRDEP